MDTIMPKGFFENTQEIYAEVASYPIVPPEKIKQYWNAYTTTFRRLFDPSAFRLENFWWHVWGSERLRNLSGPALAKLFEEISNGPTFVPLVSPAERYIRSKFGPGRRGRDGHDPEPDQALQETSGQEVPGKKEPTPSSSNPPPRHSILKKSRGPSTSGPRPTARFASPPASYEEAISVDEAVSASTAAAALEMPPPPLPPSARQQSAAPSATSPAGTSISAPPAVKPTPSAPMSTVSDVETQPPPPVSSTKGGKSTTNTGRRIVAATAASRRRPVMVRRPSLQSSAGSDAAPRVPSSAAASKRSGSKRSAPTTPQLLGQGSSSSATSEAGISVKAAGKRPAKAVPSKQSPPGSLLAQTEDLRDEPVVTTPELRPASPQRRSTWDVRSSLAAQELFPGPQTVVRRSLLPQASSPIAGFVADQPIRYRAPPMVRSRSNNIEGPQGPGVALLPSQATSSVATFSTTARGQFDSETVTTEPVVPEARDIPDQVRFGSYSSSPVLDLQFRPTPPNPAPPIPFGRSRSELTLLLKRGKPAKDDDA